MSDHFRRPPLADARPPAFGGSPTLRPVTLQPPTRPARWRARDRAHELADAALVAPRWDRARGYVVLACVSLVAMVLLALVTSAFLIGSLVLIREMWGLVQ